MITPFSTDLQYYDSTGAVPETTTDLLLNVGVLAEYPWSTGAVSS